MRKGGLSFFVWLLASWPVAVHAQKKDLNWFRGKIDSLAHYLSLGTAKPANQRCNVSSHVEYYLGNGEFYFSKDALQPGAKKDSFALVYYLVDLSTDQYSRKEYSRSTESLLKALAVAVNNELGYDELHKLRPALNNNFFFAGDYTNAMKISSDGITTAEKLKDSNRIIHFSNVIGYIHMKQRNFEQAEPYFNDELRLSKAMTDSLAEAHALCNLADLSIGRKRYDSAILFSEQARNIYRRSSLRHLFNPVEREAFVANKLAEAYKYKKELDRALDLARMATHIALNEKGLNEYDQASYFINAADIYNRLQQFDSALYHGRLGLAIATRIMHREHIRDASEQLSIAFAARWVYDSAYLYHTAFTRLKDSIDNNIDQQEILQREANLTIQQERQLQEAAMEKQKLWRNIIIGTALFALITLWSLYNRYRLRQKNRYQQELNRQQNELFNAITATQDQERKRIAEDIHDSLGSILSAAKLKLSSLKESETHSGADKLEKYQVAMQLLDDASTELRNISHNIMPASLSKLGLVAALRNLIVTISAHSGMQIDFSTHDFIDRLDEKTEMSIYRIVLELINNSVKHSAASKMTVQLIRYPDYINLTVEDNGRGFDYETEMQSKKGIGLGNIVSRVNYLSGKLNVDAAPGRGTSVIIDIPYGSA